MLTVYLHDGPDALRFRLIGELEGAGATDFGQSWKTASSTLRGRAVVIDLSDVSGIDGEGRSLLKRLAQNRAQFITASPLTETWISEIADRDPSLLASPRLSLIRRLWCLVLNCCRSAQSAAARCIRCCQPARKIW
jgi:hypothetical protein